MTTATGRPGGPLAGSRRVRFGLGALSAQTVGGTSTEVSEALALMVRSCRAAEEAGLDSVWLSEHHFADDGYLPAPITVMGALATTTERLVLSTNVAIAPMYDPVRLAEDLAVIDHLSGGRVMVGLGLGYRALEFDAFGLSKRTRVDRLEQCIRILRGAWAGASLGELGRLAGAEGVAVTPPPHQPGGPPILVGALAEAGVRRAARLADGWIAPELATVAHLERRLGWLLDEGPASRPFHVVLTMSGFIAADRAAERVEVGATHVERQYRRWMHESGDVASLAGRDHDGHAQPYQRPPYFVAGDPAQCVAQLRPWCDVLMGLPDYVLPHLTMRLTFPGVSDQATLDAVRLFGQAVVPELREPPAPMVDPPKAMTSRGFSG
jgi:alkanesulfonate monooxygenase SsuD/methylene tetrahydromethanopterin reductase-like flavin-dependent oxidoreductase (luciferase family)